MPGLDSRSTPTPAPVSPEPHPGSSTPTSEWSYSINTSVHNRNLQAQDLNPQTSDASPMKPRARHDESCGRGCRFRIESRCVDVRYVGKWQSRVGKRERREELAPSCAMPRKLQQSCSAAVLDAKVSGLKAMMGTRGDHPVKAVTPVPK